MANEITLSQISVLTGAGMEHGVGHIRAGSIAIHSVVDCRAVDRNRLQLLPKFLAHRGLITSCEDASTSELQVEEGSLWEPQLKNLSLVWHRRTPWTDTCRGLDLSDRQFSTVILSSSYNDLRKHLVAHSSIPFTPPTRPIPSSRTPR